MTLAERVDEFVADRYYDASADAVYTAQTAVMREVGFGEPIDEDDLVPWSMAVADRAGIVLPRRPVFVLDVGDEENRYGWYEAGAGVIHLHPEQTFEMCVLHELAHTVANDLHGRDWRKKFVRLVRAALGPGVAELLAEKLREVTR